MAAETKRGFILGWGDRWDDDGNDDDKLFVYLFPVLSLLLKAQINQPIQFFEKNMRRVGLWRLASYPKKVFTGVKS